jgi:hypothetical protein
MFRSFIGTTAAIAASFYVYKQANQPRSTHDKASRQPNTDPLVTFKNNNVQINYAGIKQTVDDFLQAAEDHSSLEQTTQNDAIFAPNLRMRGDTAYLRNLPTNATVTVVDSSTTRTISIESVITQHCGFWSCPKNRFQTTVPVGTKVEAPERIVVSYK